MVGFINLIAIGDSTISFPRLVVETHGVRVSLRAQHGNLFSNFKSELSNSFYQSPDNNGKFVLFAGCPLSIYLYA